MLTTSEGLDYVMHMLDNNLSHCELAGSHQEIEMSKLKPRHVGWPRPRASKLLDLQKAAPVSLYPSQQARSGRSGLSDTLLLDMSVTSPDEYFIIIAHYTYRYQITNAYNTRRCLILITLVINISKRLACDKVFENFSKRLVNSALKWFKDSWQSTSFNVCA